MNAMFVLDRILAIPEYDADAIQMGLSTHSRGVLRARGYKRTDGTEAKDRFIKADKKLEAREKAVIKGDKPLTPELAAKVKGAMRGNTKVNPLSKQIAKVGVADLLRKHEKETQPIWDKFNNGEDLSAADVAKLEKLDVKHTKERIEAKEKVKSLLIKNGAADQMGADIISANLGNEARQWDRLVKEAAKDEVKSRKVVKGKSPRDRATTKSNRGLEVTYNKQGDLSESSTAKKIKTAIASTSATPKSRKVFKGTSPRRFKKLPDDKIQNGLDKKLEIEYQSALLDGKINRSAYDKLTGNNYSDVVTINGAKTKAQKYGDYAVHQRYDGAVDSKGEAVGTSRESLLTHAPSGKWIISSEMLGAKSTPKSVKKKRLEFVAKEAQRLVPSLDPSKMTLSQRSALQDLVNKAKKGEYDKPKQPSPVAKKSASVQKKKPTF